MRVEFFLISFVTFAITLHTVMSWRPYKFRMSKVHGECLDNLCNISLTINQTSLALGFEFNTDNVFDTLTFKLLLFVINPDKTEKILFNKTIEICAYLQKIQNDQLFNMLYNDMKQYGHVITKCPVTGRYYMKDYIVDTEKLPPYMPVMKTRTDLFIQATMPGQKGKVFNIANVTVTASVDNSAGVNRLIKINGK